MTTSFTKDMKKCLVVPLSSHALSVVMESVDYRRLTVEGRNIYLYFVCGKGLSAGICNRNEDKWYALKSVLPSLGLPVPRPKDYDWGMEETLGTFISQHLETLELFGTLPGVDRAAYREGGKKENILQKWR
jgi:hypothetical protein